MLYGTAGDAEKSSTLCTFFHSIFITNWHYTPDNHWIYCFIVVLDDNNETSFHLIFVWIMEWKII